MDSNERTALHQNRLQTPCPITTDLEKKLLIIIFILVIIGVGLSIVTVSYARSKSKENSTSNLCLTEQCISTAANLHHSLDLTKDPCEDFYSFSCGKWIRNALLVGEITTQSLITLRVKELLSFSNPNLAEHELKVRRFFNACMDTSTRYKSDSEVILKDLKEFGGLPLIEENWDPAKFNWSDLMIKFHEAGYPIGVLLNIEVDQDMKNTTESLIMVNQPSLGLSERGYYLIENRVFKRYKQLILELVIHLNPKIDLEKATDAVVRALKIEKILAKATVDKIDAKRLDDYYNIVTLKEIEKTSPMVPWRYLLSKLLPNNITLSDDERMMVTVPTYLEALVSVLEEVEAESPEDGLSRADLANYMLLRAVVFAAEHVGRDQLVLLEEKRGLKKGELWQSCVAQAMEVFHMSLTASYAERYVDAETKNLLEMMFQDIQVSLMDSIKEASWLDQETKEKALVKVQKARSTMAYREEMLNEERMNDYYSPIKIGDDHFENVKNVYSFKMREKMQGLHSKRLRFRWSDTSSLLRANAFYLPTKNSIILPIALLHESMFSSGRPNYINYGSLGTVLAHEYTHTFDSTGSLYDAEGNFEMWWTNNSWNQFQKKTECFTQQYDKYYEPLVQSHVNGTNTLSENIADNGGVKSAYAAYKKLLRRIGSEQKLPGLDFSEKQMFWIAYASVWCRKQSDHNLLYTIENTVHAPAKYRILGTLSNIKEFSEDFKCKEKTQYNPEKKCTLWK